MGNRQNNYGVGIKSEMNTVAESIRQHTSRKVANSQRRVGMFCNT